LTYNFTMSLIDQFRDPSLAVLVRLVADRPAVEDLVKEAEVLPEELDTLPDTAFSWPEKRAFPIHSAEHTAMSRVYRENFRGAVPAHVDATLKEACEIYGLEDSLFDRTKIAALPDDPEDYLLPGMKRLPVRTAAQVKLAEEKLIAGYQKLSVEHRAQACKRLVDKAAALNVKLDPLMHKLAGFTVSSTAILKDWIEARKEASAEPYKAAFQKIADGLKGLPAEIRDREALVKIAEVVAELDKKAGLVKFYDRKLPDPMMSVFNTTKVAGHGVDLGGKFVSMDRLASYPSTFYGDVLGDDLVREASDGRGGMDPHKLAAILETLPRDMKMMLGQQMR